MSCNDDSQSFTSKLKQLPVATVREKLSFPLQFEKKNFCLDFASGGGSATTSDCEPTSLKHYRTSLGGKTSKQFLLKSAYNPNNKKFKKKFSSAEKLQHQRPLSLQGKRKVFVDSNESSCSDHMPRQLNFSNMRDNINGQIIPSRRLEFAQLDCSSSDCDTSLRQLDNHGHHNGDNSEFEQNDQIIGGTNIQINYYAQ